MRLTNSEHESHPWRIGEVAPDFRLEDVWALPAQGGAEDFATLLEVMASLDPANGESRATRALFGIRYRVGGWFGWDDAPRQLPIPNDTKTTLVARLPEDLRNTATGPDLSSYGFLPLYRTDVEWVASQLPGELAGCSPRWGGMLCGDHLLGALGRGLCGCGAQLAA
jgi:hypothetical protein